MTPKTVCLEKALTLDELKLHSKKYSVKAVFKQFKSKVKITIFLQDSLPLFVVNAGQVSMHHSMVGAEVQGSEVGSDGSEKGKEKTLLIIKCIMHLGKQKWSILRWHIHDSTTVCGFRNWVMSDVITS